MRIIRKADFAEGRWRNGMGVRGFNDSQTFAIFVGGLIRGIVDKIRDKRGFNDAQKARVDNAGVLTASGLIAGEALCGIVIAAIIARRTAGLMTKQRRRISVR